MEGIRWRERSSMRASFFHDIHAKCQLFNAVAEESMWKIYKVLALKPDVNWRNPKWVR
jgi:hypothetical protein